MTVSDGECQYGPCGGLGNREVKRRRKSRSTIVIGNRRWRVCESCEALLIREARNRGVEVSKER